ncbi:MAG: TraB/GumN family protein [Nanoarchaeota archaeon]|nr:TraB/GumN family protein [Nanoarchaeota archaeon]
MGRIILISTSHVAQDSAKAVKLMVEREQPQCIAVELDPLRYQAMEAGIEAPKREVLRSFGPAVGSLLLILRYAQKKIGRKLGVLAGIDMRAGVDAAREAKIPVAFIDQDIRLTALRLRTLPRREFLRIFGYLLFGLPAALIMKENIIEQVPDQPTVAEAMAFMKLKLPNLHRVLVEERNRTMAQRLAKLSLRYDPLVAVVGAGHTEGIKKLLAQPIVA